MKTKIALFAVTAMLIGCSSVSESIPTVKIEKRKSKATAQNASFVAPSTTHSAIASTKEAATVCETSRMREKVLDGNDNNDTIRIMVVEDGEGSSEILSDVEINCRDYFLRKSVKSNQSSIIRTSTPIIEDEPKIVRRKANSNYTYIVQKGDTVWDIAREHCTTAKAISRLNGLGRGNVIDIGQRLKMPDEECS